MKIIMASKSLDNCPDIGVYSPKSMKTKTLLNLNDLPARQSCAQALAGGLLLGRSLLMV